MSWQQLIDIRKSAQEDGRLAQTSSPVSCPIDGYVLDVRPNGERNCPLGNYYWRG